jgi:hypothetical protein
MSLRPDGRPWRKYRYGAMKQTFEELPGGRVRVTCDDGPSGVFEWRGPWVEGDLTQANLHMLEWCGGPDLPPELRYRYQNMPVDIHRPSGWPEDLEKLLERAPSRGLG